MAMSSPCMGDLRNVSEKLSLSAPAAPRARLVTMSCISIVRQNVAIINDGNQIEGCPEGAERV